MNVEKNSPGADRADRVVVFVVVVGQRQPEECAERQRRTRTTTRTKIEASRRWSKKCFVVVVVVG